MAPIIASQNVLTFRVGHEWYGVDIDSVLEVTYLVALTELPAASPDVLGLMTVRREVMPVIDLRLRFGEGEAALHLNTPIVCVRTERGAVGLVVDEAEDVIPVGEQHQTDYDGKESRYLRGVLRQPGRLILLLDAARLRSEIHLPADGEPLAALEPEDGLQPEVNG